MKIHEYQGKQLLSAAHVPVPQGLVAKTADEAASAFTKLGGAIAVVKSQTHAGGRGKGTFKEQPSQRGVVLVKSAEEARENAARMLGNTLVTKQTGPEGKQVNVVFVEAGLDIARELYLGIVVDREFGGPVLIMSSEGGMEIEEVAAHSPEKILKEPVDIDYGLFSYQARNLAFQLGLEGAALKSAESFLKRICRFFLDSDCSMTEINPLVVTKQGEMIALDAKISFDDNALFRHDSFKSLRDLSEENAMEVRASETGLSFVKLEGNIGCLVNGAGLAMSTMDLIKLHGGEPANFLDVGGGANVDQVTEAFRILLSDKNVKGVLVNIFGGIMKCDTIVEALLSAYEKVGFNVPLVVRLEGTNVEKAREMLAQSGRNIIGASGLTDAAKKIVEAARSKA
jgi:succinyl-CoA synthetase beta subunit